MIPDKDGCTCYDETVRECPLHDFTRHTDVHTEHCCVLHGCKYGDENCTVANGEKGQTFLCESCEMDQRERIARRRLDMTSGMKYTERDLDRAIKLAKAQAITDYLEKRMLELEDERGEAIFNDKD